MPWPIEDSWDQHLDRMNRRKPSRQYAVSLVQLEPPTQGKYQHKEHVHPYWQLDLTGKAGVSIRNGENLFVPGENDFLMIPPQNIHHFSYRHNKTSWTVKFAVAEMDEGRYPVSILPANNATRLLYAALEDALTIFIRSESEVLQAVIEHLAAAVIDLYCRTHSQGSESGLIRKVRKIMENSAAGDRTAVADIARRCGCSTTYLNRIFKRGIGIPVKVFIDQQRFETARKLLLFSKMNITEIADEMGFEDLFGFSRFFKRMSGKSPGAYRKNYLFLEE